MQIDPSTWLTVRQATRQLDLNQSTISRLIATGRLRFLPRTTRDGLGAARLSKQLSSSWRQLQKKGEFFPYCRGPGSLKELHIW